MKRKKKEITILIYLVALLVVVNYGFLDSTLESFLLGEQMEKVQVERIIDGDTIVTEIGNVRLLGMNTPERGERGFLEAKEFLEDLILNESVVLEYVGERQDKYGRILAYVFFEGENVNTKIVEEGFGNYYFYDGKDIYSNDLEEAWESCLKEEVGICKKSEDVCGECISIGEKGIVSSCSIICSVQGWMIREEGRDKFVFGGVLRLNEEKSFDLDLENSGGSLFLWDADGGLVSWRNS